MGRNYSLKNSFHLGKLFCLLSILLLYLLCSESSWQCTVFWNRCFIFILLCLSHFFQLFLNLHLDYFVFLLLVLFNFLLILSLFFWFYFINWVENLLTDILFVLLLDRWDDSFFFENSFYVWIKSKVLLFFWLFFLFLALVLFRIVNHVQVISNLIPSLKFLWLDLPTLTFFFFLHLVNLVRFASSPSFPDLLAFCWFFDFSFLRMLSQPFLCSFDSVSFLPNGLNLAVVERLTHLTRKIKTWPLLFLLFDKRMVFLFEGQK